ncbi:MAG: AbrB/MazE/SpoVT family DNA-binding domain-containing protein [Anaerolineae bacterium]|nr:AbrB/MazE/SpoVT family DNA-binding domain-containing protein [Anaerolineae bacterium]HOV49663.1 AbrB/MazE/SpoVT family DNA-binding domain-containing protein [Anaerolineae bacterium]HPD42520.1 AbrB/MazE/SpoVT family DNA-binding domain-containing protein [Anaerolineae bacterium]HXK41643.1 AbrB/MazE/SpoVT family DNA-binding domain-containing protein [Anaerolineae bacterium]
MEMVTVSPKYQVVIPMKIRRALGIKPGHKVQVIQYQDRIELIPLQPIQTMRGFLKGIDTSIECEPDRSL